MDIMLLLAIVIIILIVVAILSIAKKLVKIALVIALIIFILFVVTGGTIQSDFGKIKDNLPSKSTLVLYEDKGAIIHGFINSDKIEFLSNAELDKATNQYTNNNLGDLKQDHFMVFILNGQTISSQDSYTINNKQVSSTDINLLLTNNKAIPSITIEDLHIKGNFETADMRKAVFAYTYNELKLTASPILFMSNYKKGDVDIYPESIFFRFAKIVPFSWIEGKLNKLKEGLTNEE